MGLVELFFGCTVPKKPDPAQGPLPTGAAAFALRCRSHSGQFDPKTISSAGGLGAESQARGKRGLQKVTLEEGDSSRRMKQEAEDETRFARGLRGARQRSSS